MSRMLKRLWGMNKSLVSSFALLFLALVVVLAGIWYWSAQKNKEDVIKTPVTEPAVVVKETHVYRDSNLGFAITLPTALSSTTSDSLYQFDTTYTYTANESGELIPGVKFTIPKVVSSGTNLSSDSYISVERLVNNTACNAEAFMGTPRIESKTFYEGARIYSFASSSEAAAGNRYEEYVYALSGSKLCTAVRYFIHYGNLENYEPGLVKEFNRTQLMADFDAIRKTLIVN